ncbi:hypothetical protein [Sporosarcina psychrophila]|uniref:Uncharacterized protein n=1 Tax=Sporosarcina psychrophila TaxID=1476 RepID=A0ABV2KCW0_SPOPS
MAKMTMGLVTYEGTPEELRAIVASFEAVEDVTPAEDTPAPKTEKRHAKVGERILITRDASSNRQSYRLNDVLTVTKADVFSKGDVNVEGQASFVDYSEYEVIVEAEELVAEKLSHKGADYTLVQRKARPGDVVYVTKDAEGTAAIPNDAKYLVDVDGKIDGYEVYPKYYKRTEANVLVYEEVAEADIFTKLGRKTNEYRAGDIVKVIDGGWGEIKDGEVGTIVKDEHDDFPLVRIRGFEHYNYVELIAPAESRVDTK